MPLYLCKNEKILKNWTFASEEAGNGTYSHNLPVTNKRIVATGNSPNSISRTEIPIDSVKSINGSYYATEEKTNNPNGSIVLAGILLLIAGIILIAVFIGNLAGMINRSHTRTDGLDNRYSGRDALENRYSFRRLFTDGNHGGKRGHAPVGRQKL